jgi:hypothetical protein
VNDSGSAAIGVFSIVLQGRTQDMDHAHPIACRTASRHSPGGLQSEPGAHVPQPGVQVAGGCTVW